MDPISDQLVRGFQSQGQSHWIVRIGDSSTTDTGRGVAIDSTGNVYVSGIYYASSDYKIFAAKYNSAGTTQWQRSLSGTGSDYGYGIEVDGSGNAYVVGSTSSPGGQGVTDVFIAKISTSGTVEWQQGIGSPSTDHGYGVTIGVDGYIYVTGYEAYSPNGNDVVIAKYNSSGVLQWKELLYSSMTEQGLAVAAAPGGGVYVSGVMDVGNPVGYQIMIAKLDSSGSFEWSQALGGTGSDYGQSIASDPNGNVYIAGKTNSTPVKLVVAKYSAAGEVQWRKTLAGSQNREGLGISVDSAGNAYVVGVTSLAEDGTATPNTDILIVKYSTSGVVQWQRRLSSANTDRAVAIRVDNSGNMHIAGNSNDDIIIAKLPCDGSKLGTYGSLTYSASTILVDTDWSSSSVSEDAMGWFEVADSSGTMVSASQSLTVTDIQVPSTTTVV